ncbi:MULTISPECIES: hypothetical protein [unclassified Mesorhizobium]|uniref:hypothetical protein n=1 Tax=unclassified Mesorhizobium TaxID=325217 RepID=UPI000FE41674|nr:MULTISPECIES: hypothetical protein [unclassified Mesorhizobium]RWF33718.1 MAG: hypothetical protein EOS45_01950 [Mesorhizobium sp.]RWX68923.1 hypothetical protein EN780_07825 [Mesorhizobium sp. M4B.F.Ca.ET.089.01.1.1]
MLDHGHPNAPSYPISKVFAEAGFVVRRINSQMASEISLMQLALSSIPNESVKPAFFRNAAKQLAQQLKELTDGG